MNNSGDIHTGYYGDLSYRTNALTITGNLANQGSLTLFNDGDYFKVNGDLNNTGGISIQADAGGTLAVGGNMINAQYHGLDFGGFFGEAVEVNGNLDNAGFLEDETYCRHNTITVHGLLTNEATGQINLNGRSDLLQALGGLTNYGLINANNGSSIDPPFVNNGGTINIDSLSKMIVGTGNPAGLGYIQLANGTLGEMINSPTSYGTITVNGSALLAGTLDILLKQGFNPAVGSTFQFLLFNKGQLNGTFDTILNDYFNGGTEKWLVSYDNADGYVELTAENNPVPEPATLLVLIPGLLGVGYGLRRK